MGAASVSAPARPAPPQGRLHRVVVLDVPGVAVPAEPDALRRRRQAERVRSGRRVRRRPAARPPRPAGTAPRPAATAPDRTRPRTPPGPRRGRTSARPRTRRPYAGPRAPARGRGRGSGGRCPGGGAAEPPAAGHREGVDPAGRRARGGRLPQQRRRRVHLRPAPRPAPGPSASRSTRPGVQLARDHRRVGQQPPQEPGVRRDAQHHRVRRAPPAAGAAPSPGPGRTR